MTATVLSHKEPKTQIESVMWTVKITAVHAKTVSTVCNFHMYKEMYGNTKTLVQT